VTTERAFADLSRLFSPQHIAFVGVSRRSGTLGGLSFAFALAQPGEARISVVHPELDEIQGVPCARSISALVGASDPVDVAFISVPGDSVRSVLVECAEQGVKFAIVGSSGWAEVGDEGARRQAELVDTARAHGIRLLGPNCNGLWNAIDGLALGFNTSHEYRLRPGGIGIVGQTGAVLGSFLTGIQRAGGGLAYAVSTGNEADLDATDCFEFMAHDERCRVIVLLMDSISRPDAFERAARHARAQGKPVVAVTFGKSARGRHAAELHSSRIAGGARARSAWLRSLGIAEATDLESAMFAAAVLDLGRVTGDNLGVVSTSGAGAALIADLAASWQVQLPDFGEQITARLTEMLTFTQPYNPLDLAGHGNDAAWLADALDAVFEEDRFDAVALLSTLLPPKARGVAPVVSSFCAAKLRHDKPACAYAVGPLADEHRADLVEAGIAIADSGQALLAGLATAAEATRSSPRDRVEVTDPVDVAWLVALADASAPNLVVHDAARSEFEKLGVPFVSEESVASASDATRAWRDLGELPVAMKLMDRRLPHKATAAGLVLNVTGDREVSDVADALFGRAESADARVLLQTMTPVAIEMFVGIVNDPQAGPVVAVGRGGSDVESAPDVVVELAPVSAAKARDMILGVSSVATALAALARRAKRPVEELVGGAAIVVERMSALAIAGHSLVDSIDINPLVFSENGDLAALDVRVQLRPSPSAGA
jgi:acetate---CoA ligase (ADP-forming)